MNLPSRLALASATLVACSVALSASAETLDVRLSLPEAVVHGNSNIAVDVAVTNTADHEVTLTRWQLPAERLQGPLFRITGEDGAQALYSGALVKHAAAGAQDIVHLAPGVTLNFRVELSKAYEIGNGRFAIEYVGPGKRAGDASLASSAPLYLQTDGRSVATAAAADDDTLERMRKHRTIDFTGNCSISQQSDIRTAVRAATSYSEQAGKYLAVNESGTQRYLEWFGAFDETRWDTVHTHYAKEKNAFKTKPLVLDCACTDRGTYAYVFPNQPYKIYLCGAFWSAPMTGTDSKGGTLVHEMSHFTVVAGTHDWVYGQVAARNLARTNPDHAIDNADSHEYFAENNPFLP